jgi:N-acetylmuramoyl-L-alanine amidase
LLDPRLIFLAHPRAAAVAFGLALLAATAGILGQGPGAATLTLLSRDGARPLPIANVGGREYLALDDLASAFQLTVRDEAGAITVSARGGTAILTVDRPLASVAGQLISLAAPPVRNGARIMVPLDFINRALAPIADPPVEFRRTSRLVIVGNLRVPRVTLRAEATPGAARLTVEATPPVTTTVAQESGRLTVKFDADGLDVAIPVLQPQGLVEGIRRLDPLTLGVELGSRFGSYRATSETAGDSSSLLIEVMPSETAAAAPAPSAPSAAPADPVDVPALRSRAPILQTVAIDPGHGGDDVGARGAGGTEEKELTLAMARRLKALFESRLGLRVLLTRDADRNIPLDRRTAVANNNKADLFLSLHVNGSPRPTASGASILVASFADEDRARAGVATDRLPVFSGGLRDIELVPWDLAQIRHAERSAILADFLHQRLQAIAAIDEPPLTRGSFRVLDPANMPAVLVEMGYVTNPEQEKLLSSAPFQNRFAQAIVDAVVRFKEHLEAAGGEP